jgi:spore coat polysaccharide biosynthesis protein SpsF
LKKIGSETVLQRTVERIKKASLIDSIIVATSTTESDRAIIDHCENLGVKTFVGPLEDVGERLVQAACEESSEAFVRISGDSPFIDYRIVNEAVKLFSEHEVDLVTNILQRTFPKGQSVEVIRTSSLKFLCSKARTPEQKEHVTPYFYENFSSFRILSFTSGQDSGNSRQCIDDDRDFRIANRVAERDDLSHANWKDIDRIWTMESNALNGI